ncbi:cupin domain-containing protein [Candidatus Laterigemmans baculatus]|uniref:hypothetical protein n=1 Tax=Candidatus Laterigemmans baculatus TaxID=2770505 RepID=UPI0013DCF3F3|nr:hypothetical protein [Candidatus Laterigemmans baculatus]
MTDSPFKLVPQDPVWQAKLGRETLVASHNLEASGLFGDAALADLIERHPRQDLSVNTMGDDPMQRNEWREGDLKDFSGSELLEMVQRGRLWLNLRKMVIHHERYRDLVHGLYGDMEAQVGGFHSFEHSANLLISSPTAQVYYHVDAPLNILWHIRGTKRVWVYPRQDPFVSNSILEGIMVGERSEEIPYHTSFDESAEVLDLQPGQVVTWAQHSPHRVVNLAGLNVSLSTEHMTRAAQRRNNVHMSNHFFRRWFPGCTASAEVEGCTAAMKEFGIRVARRMPGFHQDARKGYRFPITFEVDPQAPNCVQLLNKAEPKAEPQLVGAGQA